MVSGWGELEEEVEEKEELSRKWGVALDEWEAKAGTIGHRPKELFELCRKVGTVWESLPVAKGEGWFKLRGKDVFGEVDEICVEMIFILSFESSQSLCFNKWTQTNLMCQIMSKLLTDMPISHNATSLQKIWRHLCVCYKICVYACVCAVV